MDISHGIRSNLREHALLVAATAFVGAMVGLERVVVPLLAEREFGVASAVVTLSFIASFGAMKAVANLFAGRIADAMGRKRVLVAGWILGLPVPLLVIVAPSWEWVVGANLLLGANQGLVWTMTVTMMSDLAGRRRRGVAIGANEFTGYVAIAVAGWAGARIGGAYGLRPAPLLVGLAAAAAGLVVSLGVRETMEHARAEDPLEVPHRNVLLPGLRGPGRRLTACHQAGLVTKVNDAGVWGLLPLLLADRGFSIEAIGVVAATYPLVWGLSQAFTGALGDKVGRPRLIVGGMFLQAVGLALVAVAGSFGRAVVAAAVLGLGTALAYPSLLAAVGDVAAGEGRGYALGAYRFWRDLGFVVGALGIGAVADALGLPAAIAVAAALSAGSGLAAGRILPLEAARLSDIGDGRIRVGDE